MTTSNTGAALSALWDVYWSQHSQLMSWHAATAKRRQAKARWGCQDTADLHDLDPNFIEVEPSGTHSELIAIAADLAEKDDPRPDIELLFCAIARLGPIAHCSFAPEKGPRAEGVDHEVVRSIFRAQMSNNVAALSVGRDLAPFIGFSVGPARHLVDPRRLALRGGPLLRVLEEVQLRSIRALFEVFGPCTVELPAVLKDETPAKPSPAVTVSYVDDDCDMAVLDASAALRCLQLWLAFDWCLFLTYVVAIEDPTQTSEPQTAPESWLKSESVDEETGVSV